MPLAYFITFTTYGTQLHGAGKGSGSVDRQHNEFGAPFVPPDDDREARAADCMTGPPYVMSEEARRVVRNAILGLCEEKGWRLLALHVRTSHVHVVVFAERAPGRLMSDLKARASRDLNRAEGAAHGAAHTKGETAAATFKRWTRHGSTRYLFDEHSVAAAVAYTLDGQGAPMAVYDPRPPRGP